jgi:hypothetical protein
VAGRPARFTHALRLLGEHGIVQFASGREPDLTHGYCLDDNARAWLAASLSLRLDDKAPGVQAVGEAALASIRRCRRPDGRYHNLYDRDGRFTDEVGSEESFARTVWACGVAACCAPLAGWRTVALELLAAALPQVPNLTYLRSRAYCILGLAAAVAPERTAPVTPVSDLPSQTRQAARRILASLCQDVAREFRKRATAHWPWWEDSLTWGNARLPEALLRGCAALSDPGLGEAGLEALTFLEGVTQSEGMFVPIGNRGWYEEGKVRARYDQQPIEACAMVDAWLAAAVVSGDSAHVGKALEALGWFFGLNTEGLVLVAPDGGCRDGLGVGECNRNMGAESTLSYLHAHAVLAAVFAGKSPVSAVLKGMA